MDPFTGHSNILPKQTNSILVSLSFAMNLVSFFTRIIRKTAPKHMVIFGIGHFNVK